MNIPNSRTEDQPKFNPVVIGEARFASNGNNPGRGDLAFRIVQVAAKGTCVIEDLNDPNNKLNHARSPAKAWASIRYQAGINFMTERSLGAPETEPLPKLGKAAKDDSGEKSGDLLLAETA